MPLRFPRPAMVGVAIGMASASILLGTMPAVADSVRQHEWWLSKLGVTSAWQISRGSGVIVAVLSDGVEPANPDLVGSVIAGPDFTRSGRTASGPNFGLQGTAIASLIAGHGHGTNAADGIIGVAPAAKILSVRVTVSPSDPLLTSTAVTARLPGAIAAGIRYAVRNGASVIDLPIDPGQPGAGGTGGAPAAVGGSAAERAAVLYALRKGVVLVAPAGDNGAGSDAVNYPAGYPGVISAGAFDRNLMKAAYSSHQSYVTLTAPGQGVIAATAPGSYATMSSTSAASAIVAGIAALIRSKFGVLSPAQVRRALIHSTLFWRPGGTLVGSGYGTANAARALRRAAVIAAPLEATVTASPTATRRAPARAPTAPVVPSATSSLVSKVLKAVVISAGVLILLLLPITAYAATGRRRKRKAAQRQWQRAQSDQSDQSDQSAETSHAYAGTAATPDHLDPMLEFFSPAARPPASWSAAEPARRAEMGPEDVPFLASPSRSAGPRPSAALQDRAHPGNYADFRDASSFPAAGDRRGPARDPFGPARDPFGHAGDPFGPAGDPSGHAGDPSGPAGDPSGPAGDPSGPAGDPSGPARDPFAHARDPFGPAPDPLMAAGDPATGDPAPGAAGDGPGLTARRPRGGSHSRAGSPAARPAQGPVQRPAGRQPRVSGAPPWEPAAKPDSELPWMTGPAPQRGYPAHVPPAHPARSAHRRLPRMAPPPAAAGPAWPEPQPPAPVSPPAAAGESIWDAARTARRPDAHGGRDPRADGPAAIGPAAIGPAAIGRDVGGPEAGPRDATGRDVGNRGGDGADPASSDVSSSGPGGSAEPGTGPIYVWNPGASTETFPSIRANRDPSVPVDED